MGFLFRDRQDNNVTKYGATKATTLEYTFSNNNTTLTLFNTNGAGIYLVMTRQ